MGIEMVSNVALICAVAGLALLAIFGLPDDQQTPSDTANGTAVVPPRTLEQAVAVAGVALLVAAGFFQAGQLW
jgi:hypothetical protein